MTRVALYTRVSTDRQEAENQRRQLRAFVNGHEGTVRRNWLELARCAL